MKIALAISAAVLAVFLFTRQAPQDGPLREAGNARAAALAESLELLNAR